MPSGAGGSGNGGGGATSGNANANAAGASSPTTTVTKPFVQSGQPLHEFLHSFWQRQVDVAEQETPDYRHPPLPLARIKKVMKNDPDVKVCFLHFLVLERGRGKGGDMGRC